MEKVVKKWLGLPPHTCEVCQGDLGSVFIDGKIKTSSQWAVMCFSCHGSHGYGLGVGKGQKYNTKTLEKIDG